MPKGQFEILKGGATKINIKPLDGFAKINSDQSRLQLEIYNVWNSISLLYKDNEPKIAEFRNVILQVAEVGLTGASAYPKHSAEALESIKRRLMTTQGRKLKIQYLVIIAKYGVALAALALLILFLGRLYLGGTPPFMAYALVWVGAMFGVWLSVAASRTQLTFDELPAFSGDKVEPLVRLIFTGLMAALFALLVDQGLIPITINEFDLKNLDQSVKTPLILGALAGISEKALSARIIHRASQVLDGGSA